jgi:hypothetical protein
MKALLFCILVSLSYISTGQQGIVSAGGDATGSGGSISYSVGQVVYSNNNFVNEGVQQPYEIFIISVDDSFLDVQLNLFPNPTSQELFIEMKNFREGISADVFDADGSLIDTIRLLSDRTSIQVKDWAAATYFVRLTDEAGRSAGYHVVKH